MDDKESDIYEELGLSRWPDELDRDAALDAIVAFVQVLGHTDDVDLTITSDFEDTVKAHLDPECAAAFNQDRGPYGRCMAKTMTNDDGRQVVIFDVHLFMKDMPSAIPTFRHEAMHVLIHRRGESLSQSRTAIDDHHGIHADLIAMAGIAAEEYRVERSVKPDWEELWVAFSHLCAASHNAIHEAALAYFYDHDVEAIWRTVMQAFSPLTVQAAYVAAWLDANDLQTPSMSDRDLHERMLGEPCSDAIAAFRKLPAAEVETSRDELERLVIEVAQRLEDWVMQIGFRPEPLVDGGLHFHVYEHEDWCNREPVDPLSVA